MFQSKERENEYKKTVEQLVKEKDELNHQLKMMQDGMYLIIPNMN